MVRYTVIPRKHNSENSAKLLVRHSIETVFLRMENCL